MNNKIEQVVGMARITYLTQVFNVPMQIFPIHN